MAKPESPYFNAQTLGSAALVGAAVYFDPLSYAFGGIPRFVSLAAEGGAAGALAGAILYKNNSNVEPKTYPNIMRMSFKGALGGLAAGLLGQGPTVGAAVAAALVIFLPDMDWTPWS
jgi:hypothetical protein